MRLAINHVWFVANAVKRVLTRWSRMYDGGRGSGSGSGLVGQHQQVGVCSEAERQWCVVVVRCMRLASPDGLSAVECGFMRAVG